MFFMFNKAIISQANYILSKKTSGDIDFVTETVIFLLPFTHIFMKIRHFNRTSYLTIRNILCNFFKLSLQLTNLCASTK